MRQYQGHPSWNAWNVTLWIGNDEGLYNFAIECLRKPTPKGKKPSLNVAATRFLSLMLNEKTPDGARYSRTSVRHALADLMD
jgi:hypothetical protein